MKTRYFQRFKIFSLASWVSTHILLCFYDEYIFLSIFNILFIWINSPLIYVADLMHFMNDLDYGIVLNFASE